MVFCVSKIVKKARDILENEKSVRCNLRRSEVRWNSDESENRFEEVSTSEEEFSSHSDHSETDAQHGNDKTVPENPQPSTSFANPDYFLDNSEAVVESSYKNCNIVTNSGFANTACSKCYRTPGSAAPILSECNTSVSSQTCPSDNLNSVSNDRVTGRKHLSDIASVPSDTKAIVSGNSNLPLADGNSKMSHLSDLPEAGSDIRISHTKHPSGNPTHSSSTSFDSVYKSFDLTNVFRFEDDNKAAPNVTVSSKTRIPPLPTKSSKTNHSRSASKAGIGMKSLCSENASTELVVFVPKLQK